MKAEVTPRFAALTSGVPTPISALLLALYYIEPQQQRSPSETLALLSALMAPTLVSPILAFALQKRDPIRGLRLVIRNCAITLFATLSSASLIHYFEGGNESLLVVLAIAYSASIATIVCTVAATQIALVFLAEEQDLSQLTAEIRQQRWETHLLHIRMRLQINDALRTLNEKILPTLDEINVVEPNLSDNQFQATIERTLDTKVRPLSSEIRPVELKWGIVEAIADLGIETFGLPEECVVISDHPEVHEELYSVVRRLSAQNLISRLTFFKNLIIVEGTFASPSAQQIIENTSTPSLNLESLKSRNQLQIAVRKVPRLSRPDNNGLGTWIRLLTTSEKVFNLRVSALISVLFLPSGLIPSTYSTLQGFLAACTGVTAALTLIGLFQALDRVRARTPSTNPYGVVVKFVVVGLGAGFTFYMAAPGLNESLIAVLLGSVSLWVTTCFGIAITSSIRARNGLSVSLLRYSQDLMHARLSRAREQIVTNGDELDSLWHGYLQGRLAAIAVMVGLGKSEEARREFSRLVRTDLPTKVSELRHKLKTLQHWEGDSLLTTARSFPVNLTESFNTVSIHEVPSKASDLLRALVAAFTEVAYHRGGAQNIVANLAVENGKLSFTCTADAFALQQNEDRRNLDRALAEFCNQYQGMWNFYRDARGVSVKVEVPFPLHDTGFTPLEDLEPVEADSIGTPMSAFSAGALLALTIPLVRWMGFSRYTEPGTFLNDLLPAPRLLVSNIGAGVISVLLAYLLQRYYPLKGWSLSVRQGLLTVIAAQSLVSTLNYLEPGSLTSGGRIVIFYTFFITASLGTRFIELVIERRAQALVLERRYSRQVVLSSRFHDLVEAISATRALGNQETLNSVVVQELGKLVKDDQHSSEWIATRLEELQSQVVRPMSHSMMGDTETAIIGALNAIAPSANIRLTPAIGKDNADPYLWVTVEIFNLLVRIVRFSPQCSIEMDDQREQVVVNLGRRKVFRITDEERRSMNISFLDDGEVLLISPQVAEPPTRKFRTARDFVILMTTGPALHPHSTVLVGLVLWPIAAFIYTTSFSRGLAANLAAWTAAIAITGATAPWLTTSIRPTAINACRVLFIYMGIGFVSGEIFSMVRQALGGPDTHVDVVLGVVNWTICHTAIHIVSTLGRRNERSINELRRITQAFRSERRHEMALLSARDERLATFLHQTVQGRMSASIVMLRSGQEDQAKRLVSHLIESEIPEYLQGSHTESSALRPSLLAIPVPLQVTQHIDRAVFRSLTPALRGRLSRVIGEAAVNAFRHGGARNLDVTLVKRGANIHLICRDDGRGLPAGAPVHGLGLDSVAALSESLDGFWRIYSDASGATLTLQFPADEIISAPMQQGGRPAMSSQLP